MDVPTQIGAPVIITWLFSFGLLSVGGVCVPKTCPFRKFYPAWIRIVGQNHRIIESDGCDPACGRNIYR